MINGSMRRFRVGVIVCFLCLACRPEPESITPDKIPEGGVTMPILTVTSPAFQEGAMIPRKYTCDGDNVSCRGDAVDDPFIVVLHPTVMVSSEGACVLSGHYSVAG